MYQEVYRFWLTALRRIQAIRERPVRSRSRARFRPFRDTRCPRERLGLRLLRPTRFHRIDRRRAPRGQVARERRSREDDNVATAVSNFFHSGVSRTFLNKST